MVESSDKSGEYHATNVVTDLCTDTTLNGKTTFWVAPDRSTGLSAHFIVEIGCEKTINRIILRNGGGSNRFFLRQKCIFFFETSFSFTQGHKGLQGANLQRHVPVGEPL